jgi:multidrug resistance protein
MKPKNINLLLLSFIMVVNALSYGVIIPLLYPYASRFGVNPFGMSLLFATYSLAQFLATPILGRLSDRYGRKPLLLFSILGTSLSLAGMALASNIVIFAIARFIDGITGGNISVAQAIISDTAQGEERAKAFGMLGAAFGIGFLFGPAIGGGLSTFGITAPFWFSSALALVAVILGFFLLPETLDPRQKRIDQREPLFRFDTILHALFTPFTGVVLLISFVWAAAMNAFFIGFQAYVTDVLKLHTREIGLIFSSFGLIGILMQFFGIGLVMKYFHSKKNILVVTTLLSSVAIASTYFTHTAWPFFFTMMAFGTVSALRDPMLTSLLTERTRKDDQGEILGINQAYISLGQIVGPLLGGLVANTQVSRVFLLSSGMLVFATIICRWLYIPIKQKVNL